MSDAANMDTLGNLKFTLPITLEDVEALRNCVRSLEWSAPISIDVYSHDGKHVRLTVTVGKTSYVRDYHGV